MSTPTETSPSSSSPVPSTSGSTVSNEVSFNWSLSPAELAPHLTEHNTWRDTGASCLDSQTFNATSEPGTVFQLKLYASTGTVQFLLIHCDIEQLKVKQLKLTISGENVTKNEKEIVQGTVRKSLTPPTGCLTFAELIKLDYISPPQSYGYSNHYVNRTSASTCLNISCTFTYTKQYPPPLKRLSEDLASLCKRPRFTDMTIVCYKDSGSDHFHETREFPVHRAILSARSKVFETMFTLDDSRESLERRIDIRDIDPEVMEALLDYLYSGNTGQIDLYAIELLVAADKYDIQCLLQLCVQSLISNRRVETASEVLYIADLYRLDDLKNEIVTFINQNPSWVRRTDGWNKFILPNPLLMQQLYDDLASSRS